MKRCSMSAALPDLSQGKLLNANVKDDSKRNISLFLKTYTGGLPKITLYFAFLLLTVFLNEHCTNSPFSG